MTNSNLTHRDRKGAWAPERPLWKQTLLNFAMRSTGRLAACMNGSFGSRANNRPGILTYHRVASRVRGLSAPSHNVEPAAFYSQLKGLLNRGYSFLSLSQLLACTIRDENLPERTVVVTFDDGFASVYSSAFPVLQRLGIPATVFLNTAYVDASEPFPFDAWGVASAGRAPVEAYRPLTTAECREMLDSGLIELGAHTHTHRDLRGRPEEFRVDLARSVKILRDRFDLDDVAFSFPYGSVHAGFASEELIDAARSTGVSCGLTTQPRLIDLSESAFRWGRFNAFSWDTAATLSGKLNGWYSWAPTIRRAVAGKLQIFHGSSVAGFASDTLFAFAETL